MLELLQWNLRTNTNLNLQWMMEGEEMEASDEEHVLKNLGTGRSLVSLQ